MESRDRGDAGTTAITEAHHRHRGLSQADILHERP
jgi:hypothetical protein